uniref:M15 family metallopeptidase n=1 Tax=uncultured Deinococcus sp. TaxID=158789 RepID=UPI0025E47E13
MTLSLVHPLSAAEREQLKGVLAARPLDTPTGLAAGFGRFRYTEDGDGRVTIRDDAWVRANIVEIDVLTELPGWPVNATTRQPQRKIYLHRLARLPLLLAWREIRARGLHTRLRTYDGCWVPRHKLYRVRDPLSVHSWAGALDLDASWNGYGVRPVIDALVIEIFEMFGFVWGGRWDTPDGMHLQFTRPLPGTAVPSWQDGALRAVATPATNRPGSQPPKPPSAPPGAAQPAVTRPTTVAIPRVFLRAQGGDGNEVMDAKTEAYGQGRVTPARRRPPPLRSLLWRTGRVSRSRRPARPSPRGDPMIRIIRPSALLLAVLVGGVVGLWALSLARAQVIDPTTGLTYPDPRVLGSSWWQLGLLVFAVMSSLKRAAGRTWGEDVAQWPRVLRNAWTWYLAAVGLGVVAAFALSGMRYGAALTFQGLTYPWTVLAFGVLAGLVGAGGRDALKWFGEVIGSALSATTAGRGDLPTAVVAD